MLSLPAMSRESIGHDLTAGRLELDLVPAPGEPGVVGAGVVLLPVVDHAGHEVERDALPATALGVDPAGAVTAGRGTVDVGGAVELAGHRALQLHLPRRGRFGHRDLVEPLDGPVPLGDLGRRGLGDRELERPVLLGDRLTLVLVGDEDGELAVGGLLLARRRVERREPVAGDLAVGERHAVAVLGHERDAVGLRDAADEVGEVGEWDAPVPGRRRDATGAALDAGVALVGGQRLQLAHGERPAAVLPPHGQDDRAGRAGCRRGLAARVARVSAGAGRGDQRHGDGRPGFASALPRQAARLTWAAG